MNKEAQVVIKIDENLLDGIKSDDFDFARQVVRNFQATIASAIASGTVLSLNPTNGDMIKALFPNQDSDNGDSVALLDLDGYVINTFPKKWWNTPYQKGGKE